MRDFEREAAMAVISANPVPLIQCRWGDGIYAMAGDGKVAASIAFKVTRASPGGRIAANKLIAYSAADTPLLDYHPVTGAFQGLIRAKRRSYPLLNARTPSLWDTQTNIILSEAFALGADGGMTAWRLAGTSGTAAHLVGQTVAFTKGTICTIVAYATSMDAAGVVGAGNTYLRLALPTPAFGSTTRSATFDLLLGTVANVQSAVYATIEPGPLGLWCCRITAICATTTSGVVEVQINGNGSASPMNFNGSPSRGLLISEPRVEVSEDDFLLSGPMPPSASIQVRQADDISLIVPEGGFEALATDEMGVRTFQQGLLADAENPLLLPVPPNGRRTYRSVDAWEAGRLSDGHRAARTVRAAPTPLLALRFGSGITQATGGKIARWDSVGGAPGYAVQADPTAQLTLETLTGGQLPRANGASWMSLQGYTRPNPMDFTVMGAVRVLGTTQATILGGTDSAGAMQIDFNGGTGVLRATSSSYVGLTSQKILDEGGFIFWMVRYRGDFRSLGVNDDVVAEPDSIGPAIFAAPAALEICRRAVGSQMFNGFLGELTEWGSCLTDTQAAAEFQAMQDRCSVFPGLPAVFRQAYAGVTHNSFEARADLSGATDASVVRLFVATDEAMTNRVFSSAPLAHKVVRTSTTVAPTNTGRARIVKGRASGLPPAAQLYGRFEIDGVAGPVFAVKTRSTPGIARAHDFVIGSCTRHGPTTKTAILPYIADLNPGWFELIGDGTYSNSYSATPEYAYYRDFRYMLLNPGLQAIAARVAMEYTWDNHDAGWSGVTNDGIYNGVLGKAIIQASLQAFLDTVPLGTLADPLGRTIARSQIIDAALYIRLDCISQRYSAGAPSTRTMLGNTTLHPEQFDQVGWCLSEMATAAARGCNRMAIFSTTGTAPNGDFNRWGYVAPGELAAIYDLAATLDVPCMVYTGDYHSAWADDGQTTDWSTVGATIPMLCSSPLYQGAGGTEDQLTRAWAGVLTVTNLARVFHHLFVRADGGFLVNEYRRSATSGTDIQLRTSYDSASLVPNVVCATATQAGMLAVSKTQQTLAGLPASVNYTWGDGTTGTITWKPNQKVARIPARPTPTTITFSSPARCVIPPGGDVISVTA